MDDDTDTDDDGNDTNPRICLCNRRCRPAHCEACTSATQPCPKHVPVVCSTPTCNNQFHLQCLVDYGHAGPNDDPASIQYKCMECETGERARTVDIAESDLPRGSLGTKLRRIGVVPPPNNADRNEMRRHRTIYKNVKDKMEDHMLKPPHRQPVNSTSQWGGRLLSVSTGSCVIHG